MPGQPDPKPGKKHRADTKEWGELRSVLLPRGAFCACGCGRRAHSLHHLVGRDQGGDDVIENLVPLAGSGTTLCHGAVQYGQRTWDAAQGVYVDPEVVARGIRKRMTKDAERYIIEKKGGWWLEKVYPGGPEDNRS